MKKIICCVLTMLLLLSLCACGNQKENEAIGTNDATEEATATTSTNETTEPAIVTIQTPYADLRMPGSFANHVTYKVMNENPYTIEFSSVLDGESLFTIIMNGTGDNLIGTILGENENTVVYMNIPTLDRNSENAEANTLYQDVLNDILNYLTEDYNFTVGEIIEYEDNSTFAIETSVVTMQYPNKWKDKVQIDVSDDGVKLSTDGTPLFDIMFIECDGYLLGTYHSTPIYIMEYEIDTDEQANMLDDVNVILEHLMADSNFVIGG